MRSAVIILLNLSLCMSAVACGVPQGSSTKSVAEQEIRAALCEIDQQAYGLAQKRIERLLQSDPANLDARKVLLGILAAQIKPGETLLVLGAALLIGVVRELGVGAPTQPGRAAGFYLPATPDVFDQIHMMVHVRGDPMTLRGLYAITPDDADAALPRAGSHRRWPPG